MQVLPGLLLVFARRVDLSVGGAGGRGLRWVGYSNPNPNPSSSANPNPDANPNPSPSPKLSPHPHPNPNQVGGLLHAVRAGLRLWSGDGPGRQRPAHHRQRRAGTHY